MLNLPRSLQMMLGQECLQFQDAAFADLIGRMQGGGGEALLWGAALASAALNEGHACLDLAAYAGRPVSELSGAADGREAQAAPRPVRLPELEAWLAALRAADRTVADAQGEATAPLPLVLDAAGRLYLHRYYQYEQKVANLLRARAEAVLPLPAGFDARLGVLLDLAFGPRAGRQKLACFLALTRRLLVLSGGPGTGKTHTMARLTALLVAAEPGLRVRLAAPTGKAANRMQESLREAKGRLPAELAARTAIPETAETLHRLLGVSADGRRYLRHRQNPVEAEVVIVDEASMIALPLMAALLEALPANCRLILLGDMDQLASVEPGAVLGDICRAGGGRDVFSPAVREAFATATGSAPADESLIWAEQSPLGDVLVALTESRRFPDTHPVARLSRAVQAATDEAGAETALAEFAAAAARGRRFVAGSGRTAPRRAGRGGGARLPAVAPGRNADGRLGRAAALSHPLRRPGWTVRRRDLEPSGRKDPFGGGGRETGGVRRPAAAGAYPSVLSPPAAHDHPQRLRPAIIQR